MDLALQIQVELRHSIWFQVESDQDDITSFVAI